VEICGPIFDHAAYPSHALHRMYVHSDSRTVGTPDPKVSQIKQGEPSLNPTGLSLQLRHFRHSEALPQMAKPMPYFQPNTFRAASLRCDSAAHPALASYRALIWHSEHATWRVFSTRQVGEQFICGEYAPYFRVISRMSLLPMISRISRRFTAIPRCSSGVPTVFLAIGSNFSARCRARPCSSIPPSAGCRSPAVWRRCRAESYNRG
jgi:hypothetical protein